MDVNELIALIAKGESLYEEMGNKALDTRIAERDGGAIEAAKAAEEGIASEWYCTLIAAREGLRAFLSDAGIDPDCAASLLR